MTRIEVSANSPDFPCTSCDEGIMKIQYYGDEKKFVNIRSMFPLKVGDERVSVLGAVLECQKCHNVLFVKTFVEL